MARGLLDGFGFYAMASAAIGINLGVMLVVVLRWVRSTPFVHTLVMLISWVLYQIAYRWFTTSPVPSPWPACGFCPRSLSLDPGENSRICTGFIGSVERWMVLPWQFPWTGGNTTAAAAAAGGGVDRRTAMVQAIVWWPTFALCILGFAVGPFTDVIRVMIWRMQRRVRRLFKRRRA